jgi:chromosome segregation ATPase
MLVSFKDRLNEREAEIKQLSRDINAEKERQEKLIKVKKISESKVRRRVNDLEKGIRGRDEEIWRLNKIREELEFEKVVTLKKTHAKLERKSAKIEALNDKITKVTLESHSRIENLERELREKEGALEETTKELYTLRYTTKEQNAIIQGKDFRLTQLQDELAKARAESLSHKNEAELLRGVLHSFKKRKAFRVYKFITNGTKRVFINYPRLIFLFGMNFLTNVYMFQWVKRNKRRIFPAQ